MNWHPDCYRDIPSRRGVPNGRGVSHRQTQTENKRAGCVAPSNQTDRVCRTVKPNVRGVRVAVKKERRPRGRLSSEQH